MFKIRPYQQEVETAIYSAWQAGVCNIALVLPTGSGKTVVFSDIIRRHNGACCAIAHRQELVSQISTALAREGVRHKIIGPKSVVKLCVSLHVAETGRSYYDPTAPCAVAGIDTLIRREVDLRQWAQTVTLWVMDETHHLLRENKWGKGISIFPNARGLGVTATPTRADGKGLGAHNHGVMHHIIEGPNLRQLVNMGYLTDYRVFAPRADIDLSNVPVSTATGDYSPPKLKIAVRKSKIVGDVVSHYLRIARGKLGVTFATDVQTANDIASQFRAAGVPAEAVSAETPDIDRINAIKKFKSRQILQLVNVDLFGEGFDLPAVEVISFARPTKSYALYVQQFGRGLRVMVDSNLYDIWDSFTNEQRHAHIAQSGKPTAIIIDHVNNVLTHGLPDSPRKWSLDCREKRAASPDDIEPIRVCQNPECLAVYSRFLPACPFCGNEPKPVSRSSPEFVDGNLLELDAETLAKMRGEIARIDEPTEDYRRYLAAKNVPIIGQMALVKKHGATREAQAALRETIAWWAGFQRAAGRGDAESYKRFYHKFGIDVLSAKALNSEAAGVLNETIRKELLTYEKK